MKRIITGLIAAGLALVACVPATAAAPKSNHWYHKEADYRWCSYPSEAGWAIAWADTESYEGADASITSGKLRALLLTTSSESGDWVIYDNYLIKDGQVVGLEREYSTFWNGGIRVIDTYIQKAGKLHLTSRRFVGFDYKPIKKPADYEGDRDVPIISKLSDFGFYPVLYAAPKTKPICTSKP